jgi:DNA-binding NtrC family response regulator
LKKFSVVNHKKIAGIDKDAMEFLLRASWPGNVRELENAVERAIVLAEAEQLSIADFTWSEEKASVAAKEIVGPAISLESTDHLNDFIVPSSETLPTLEEVTNRYVSYAVARNGGVKDKTARDLGIDRKTLYRKLHCLQHPEQPESRCS